MSHEPARIGGVIRHEEPDTILDADTILHQLQSLQDRYPDVRFQLQPLESTSQLRFSGYENTRR